MNIFFNKKSKLLYFQDNYGNEYDLNGFSRGFMGADGEKGDQGEKGEKGDPGPCGPKGDRGYNGKNGEKGEKGEQGEMGPPGKKGDRGIRGIAGEQGPRGLKGEIGERGPKGDKGDRGDCGPKGDRGEQGIRGPKGDKGERGDRGERGAPGICSCSGNNVTSLPVQQVQESRKLFLSEGQEILIKKKDLNFEVPCSSNNILSLKFTETLKNNNEIYDVDNCCNSKITLKEKGIYKITYNVCWYIDVNNIVKQEEDHERQHELVKEAKKTIKGGIVCFLYENDDMIHQSTVHNQGSVFVNSATHTFIVNKKSSRSYNNLAIGIHKGYESKENIDISIHQEGTYLEIEALN